MRRNYFENHENLCNYIIDKARDGFYSVAVLFYEDAIKLIRELMFYEDITVESLEIAPPKHNGYDKEYYISLTDDLYASVEPAYVDGRYLNAEADLTLIDSDACYAIIKDLPEKDWYEIYIGATEEECCD